MRSHIDNHIDTRPGNMQVPVDSRRDFPYPLLNRHGVKRVFPRGLDLLDAWFISLILIILLDFFDT